MMLRRLLGFGPQGVGSSLRDTVVRTYLAVIDTVVCAVDLASPVGAHAHFSRAGCALVRVLVQHNMICLCASPSMLKHVFAPASHSLASEVTHTRALVLLLPQLVRLELA